MALSPHNLSSSINNNRKFGTGRILVSHDTYIYKNILIYSCLHVHAKITYS